MHFTQVHRGRKKLVVHVVVAQEWLRNVQSKCAVSPIEAATRTAKILKISDGFRLAKTATTLQAMLQHNFWFISFLYHYTTTTFPNFQIFNVYIWRWISLSVFFNSTRREFAYINFCQSERVGIIARNSAEVSNEERSLFEWRFCCCSLRGIFIIMI